MSTYAGLLAHFLAFLPLDWTILDLGGLGPGRSTSYVGPFALHNSFPQDPEQGKISSSEVHEL